MSRQREQCLIQDMAQQVIVTGATSGIGRAAALRFGRRAASVLVVGRDEAGLSGVAAEIAGRRRVAETCQADVTAARCCRIASSRRALDRFGALTTLVNAAGIIGSGSVENTTDADWDVMMDVNARAPFRLMRAAAPALIASRGIGRQRVERHRPARFPTCSPYCVSKAAIDQLTRCAALELAPKGVRVNAVNPGVVVTNLHRRGGMTEEIYATFLARARETHPLGRPGDAAEIADLIFFLASDQSGWITGETISIDGGRHLTCAR